MWNENVGYEFTGNITVEYGSEFLLRSNRKDGVSLLSEEQKSHQSERIDGLQKRAHHCRFP